MAQDPLAQQQNSDAEAGPDLGDFRMTPQRREIYDVLMSRKDHPSASDVFVQVKDTMPTISLATVYNCLEPMTQGGIVRQVNMDREPSRYCANLAEHAHFYCQACGQVSDVPLTEADDLTETLSLRKGSEVARLELTVRGTCPTCAPAGTSNA